MKKARGKAAEQTGNACDTAAFGKPVDLEALRGEIAEYVGDRGLAMVKTVTDEAVKAGNLATLKHRFEMIGLYPAGATSHAEDAEGNDLARALLARTGLRKRDR